VYTIVAPDISGGAYGLRIGIRELRDKLASYMESTVPIEVTRHGQIRGILYSGSKASWPSGARGSTRGRAAYAGRTRTALTNGGGARRRLQALAQGAPCKVVVSSFCAGRARRTRIRELIAGYCESVAFHVAESIVEEAMQYWAELAPPPPAENATMIRIGFDGKGCCASAEG